MKIKSLKLDNFSKYNLVDVVFNDNVTYLVGPNGAGKSKLGIDAIWFLFEGIAEKSKTALIGERFRFIGEKSATARGEMVLFDEEKQIEIKVIRKLTKSGSELFFEAPDGMELNQEWLSNLFNIFLIAPAKFVELSPKEQALALGIDTVEYDQKIVSIKDNATYINRDLKNLGVVEPVEPTEPVNYIELVNSKNDILKENEKEQEKQKVIDYYNRIIKSFSDQVDENSTTYNSVVANNINLHSEIIDFVKMKIDSLPKPLPPKPTTDIDEKINKSVEINQKATKYQEYKKWLDKKDVIVKQIEDNKASLKAAEEERLKYIKSKKLPFSNLSIDENGGLLLDGRPIKPQYFSQGQLIKVVPILMTSMNPELKYVFIQNFNLLDEENQKMIEEYLVSKGFQLVIELVGKESKPDKNCILLKDCKVVESFDQKSDDNQIKV